MSTTRIFLLCLLEVLEDSAISNVASLCCHTIIKRKIAKDVELK